MLRERTVDWTRSWKEMGIEEGRKEGEATVLLRLLERKFGAGSAEHYRDRIDAAGAETLLVWSERILTAETADAVFAEGRKT